MRDQTEWVDTVKLGWNQLRGASSQVLLVVFKCVGKCGDSLLEPYGRGDTSVRILTEHLKKA